LQRPQWPAGVRMEPLQQHQQQQQHQHQLPPPLPAQNGPTRALPQGPQYGAPQAEHPPHGVPQLVAAPVSGSVGGNPGYPESSGEPRPASGDSPAGGDVTHGQGSGLHGPGVAGGPCGPPSAPYPPNGMYPHHSGGMPAAAVGGPGMIMPGPVPYLIPSGSVPMAVPGAGSHPPGQVHILLWT
jgi:hypothetical protein